MEPPENELDLCDSLTCRENRLVALVSQGLGHPCSYYSTQCRTAGISPARFSAHHKNNKPYGAGRSRFYRSDRTNASPRPVSGGVVVGNQSQEYPALAMKTI
jgi:hypothetical protein